MKKALSILFVLCLYTITTYAQHVTEGNYKTYTLNDLINIPESGVISSGENVYVINETLTISKTDTLKINEGNMEIKLGENVEIIIEGLLDCRPIDTTKHISFSCLTENTDLGGFYLKDESIAYFSNIKFDKVAIRQSSTNTVNIHYCNFSNTSSKTTKGTAISILDSGDTFISHCNFSSGKSAAIQSPATRKISVFITNNILYDNNTENSNRPQINLSCLENSTIVIKNNQIIGTKRDNVGGIGISNMINENNTGKVIIEKNRIYQCRYGIACLGAMTAQILHNDIIDNKYAENEMKGGSGINILDPKNNQECIITGNRIEDNLWGITIVSGGKVNAGKLDTSLPDYNPGENTFRNNGNNNKLYDLYNNSPNTVYAQGNSWDVAIQDSISIEEVIYHSADDSTKGVVIFMYTSMDGIENITFDDHQVTITPTQITFTESPKTIEIYAINGTRVDQISNPNSNTISISHLPKGIYILKTEINQRIYTKKFIH